ncbi:F-box/WD repeat-containing protein [Rhodotorula paludigena]|uniref:F-box/WD repeat-containing protein n=1 Tax=Rhodotorula paludigena TaxID=86838 RepID=UPI00316D26FF
MANHRDPFTAPGPSAAPAAGPGPFSVPQPRTTLPASRIRGLSPPTPAPSPQPVRVYPVASTSAAEASTSAAVSASASSSAWQPQGYRVSHHSPFFDAAALPPDTVPSPTRSTALGGSGAGEAPPSPLSEADLVAHLRAQVNALSRRAREHLLASLIRDTTPIDLSQLYPLIAPRLQRDFLRTLPLELALHVLSFIDDHKTLARASAVSRYWRALVEDDGVWKRMCWRSGFVPLDPPPPPPSTTFPPSPSFASPAPLLSPQAAASRLRTLEFGTRARDADDALFTPAGRERRGTLDRSTLEEIAARAQAFGGGGGGTSASGQWGAGEIGGDEGAAGPAMGLGLETGVPSLAERRGVEPAEPVMVPQLATAVAGLGLGAVGTAVTSPLQQSVPPPPAQQQQQQLQPLAVPAIQFGTIPPGPPLGNPYYVPPVPPYHYGPSFASPPSLAQPLAAAPPKPFSYKSHFKLAFLSEQNWLRGPGTLLSTQMSVDSGVVTSMSFDDEWIVVGMDTNKVHIFESGQGTYVRTLAGHELGVWCLTLVSRGGGPRPDDGGVDAMEDDDEGWASDWDGSGKGKGKARARPPASPMGASFSQPGASSAAGLAAPASSSFFGGAAEGARTPLAASTYTSPGNGGPGPRPRRRRSFSAFDAPNPTGVGDDDDDEERRARRVPRPSTCGGMGVGAGGPTGDSTQQGGVCGTARGWGQEGARVVSGGSDRNVRVWDVRTGRCLHVLPGHTSTVRCLRVLDGRPIAVSGARDGSIRVWDIDKGVALRTLSGHRKSVRAIEVCGNRIVSGSYDTTARLWDVDTGECLHVFRGHIGEIYSVAFDGTRVITGSLDSTVRVWSAETGEFLALLQGHTLLVGQMQLDPYNDVLVTAGSDGFVMVFSLVTYEALHRIKAHNHSVTSLQFDERFIVTGGNDGRFKLWDLRSGAFIRDLAEPCDTIWRALVRDDKIVSLSRREDRIFMDVKTFKASDEEIAGTAAV